MSRSHSHRVLVAVALAGLAVLAAAAFAALAPETLRATSAQLLSAQTQAKQLAAQIADLDAGISGAADRCAQAGDRLSETRAAIRRTRRLQAAGREDLTESRATLAQRAVALYKQDDISTLAAILSADDFAAMVGHLSLVHAVVRADQAILAQASSRCSAACSVGRRRWPRTSAPPDASCSGATRSSRPSRRSWTSARLSWTTPAPTSGGWSRRRSPAAPAPAASTAPSATTSGTASSGGDSGGDQSSAGGSGPGGRSSSRPRPSTA